MSYGGGWFVFDPEPDDEPWPSLFGPFETQELAEDYANVSHPEDSSGNTVVLQAVQP